MATRKNKILTKEWAHSITEAAGGLFTEPDPTPWLIQEDIEIIGWSIRNKVYPTITQDCLIDGYVELSQAPAQGMDGALEGVRTSHMNHYGIAGGYASGNITETQTHFLPAGEHISLKEGEYLNLHAQVETAVGVVARMAGGVIVFYRKA